MKLQAKYVFIILSAITLIFMVKMCKSDDFLLNYQEEKIQVNEIQHMQATSDSLLNELLIEFEGRDNMYKQSVDSLHGIIEQGQVSTHRPVAPEYKVETVKSKDVMMLPKMRLESSELISLKYALRDTIIYNIIIVDSVVRKTVYKIDTIYYDSKDVKRLKIRNN